MAKLRHLLHLSRWQWAILLQTGLLLPLISLGLPVFGFKRLLRWLKAETVYTDNLSHARNLAVWVDVAVRNHPIPSKCLSRSMLLWYLLQKEQINAELVIGVSKVDKFSAHAWVVYQGQLLNDSQERIAGYQPIFTNGS